MVGSDGCVGGIQGLRVLDEHRCQGGVCSREEGESGGGEAESEVEGAKPSSGVDAIVVSKLDGWKECGPIGAGVGDSASEGMLEHFDHGLGPAIGLLVARDTHDLGDARHTTEVLPDVAEKAGIAVRNDRSRETETFQEPMQVEQVGSFGGSGGAACGDNLDEFGEPVLYDEGTIKTIGRQRKVAEVDRQALESVVGDRKWVEKALAAKVREFVAFAGGAGVDESAYVGKKRIPVEVARDRVKGFPVAEMAVVNAVVKVRQERGASGARGDDESGGAIDP